jgi:NitT/TauT family transport system ATP-binding protein
MSLEASRVSVTYTSDQGKVAALDAVDLTLQEGEFLTLIGPSGCGKSTLLHSLGGLLAPTSGTVQFNGERFSEPDPSRAAFVFQDYSLLPWKTAVENVAIGLRFARVRKDERRRRAMELLELVGLQSFAEAYPHALSGGMQQRVAVARAMIMRPDVLLMDEPFGALDEQTRRQLGYEMCSLLTEQNKSLIMVTHALDEAIFWADRIVVMAPSPGRVAREIRVDEPRPRELSFIGTPEFVQYRSELFELLQSFATANPTTAGDREVMKQ